MTLDQQIGVVILVLAGMKALIWVMEKILFIRQDHTPEGTINKLTTDLDAYFFWNGILIIILCVWGLWLL